MKTLLAAAGIVGVLFTAGCSTGTTPTDSRTLAGQLDTTQVRLVNAQVVARAASGQVFRAPIAASGAWSLTLPAGSRYTIRFANATSAPNVFDTFAVLASTRANGARTHWYAIGAGARVVLGRVARPGTQSVGAACDCGGGGGDSSGDDHMDEKEDDGAEVCDVAGGKDEVEVEGDHDLLDDCDSNHDGVSDKLDTKDDGDDHDDAELDHDCEAPCMGGAPGGTTGGTPTPPTPVSGVIP